MPTLTIGDRKVNVGDDFLKLSPDEQSATVEEIAKSLGPAPVAAAPVEAAPAAQQAAPAAPAVAPEAKGTLQTIREAIHAPTRALENGFLMGLGDRARAVMGAAIGEGRPTLSGLVTGEPSGYGGLLKKEQAETERFANDHPIAAPVIETIGGIAAPLGVIGAAAKGVSLGAKTLIGAGTGGAIGGVQGVLGSKDWTDLPQVGKDAAIGTGAGVLLGGLLPGTAKVAGAGFQKAADFFRGNVEGMSRGASGHLVKAVTADTPAAVQQRLAELGPDAMMADAGPALLGKAQGASLNSDEGRSVLQNALTTRNEGTNARIMGDVSRALGPAEDPQTVTNAIRAHRSAVDEVAYPAALNNAPPVRTAPILRQIEDMIPRSVGNEQRALTNLRDMMMTTERRPLLDAQGHPQYDHLGNERFHDVQVSQNDAGVLHKVKQELDNVIEYDAPGLGVAAGALTRQQGVLRHMRGQVNEALEQQVPGYLAANRQSAALARRGDAVELGTQYLGNGKTTASPDRFAHEFGQLQPGEQIAFAKGSRGEVERKLGTKANDLQALRGELQGEGGWNTAKIATVHGQPAADELMASVDRNLKFRDTHNKVVENSQTAQRNAAAKEMKPDPSSETPFINPNATLSGMAATAVKKGVLGVVHALTKSDPTRHYGEVARALSAQGSDRDRRLLAVVDAINARQGHAAIAPRAGNTAAVVAALLEKGGLDALRGSPTQRQGR